MEFIYEGSVAWVFPDNFDIDLIIGVQNVRENNIDKLIPVCMNAFDPDFLSKAKPGDIFVGGRNFGYGHAHAQVMAAIRRIGINVIIAESFAPFFFRGEIGNGMALLRVPGIAGSVSRFDKLRVEYEKGVVNNLTTGVNLTGTAPSYIELDLVKSKGYLEFLKKELAKL